MAQNPPRHSPSPEENPSISVVYETRRLPKCKIFRQSPRGGWKYRRAHVAGPLWWRNEMTFTTNMLVPAIALIAGVLALITPRLANFWIAIYLIVIGVIGLAPSFGFDLGLG
jgi:hypothetical protein